jgi:hypothetical protein
MLLARHAVAATGTWAAGLHALLAPSSGHEDATVDEARRYQTALEEGSALLSSSRALTSQSLADLAERVGVAEGPRAALVSLDPLLRVPTSKAPPLLKATMVAGAVATLGAADPSVVRLSAMAGALVLVSGGALDAPWIAPWRLDAAGRGAAVQVERYGQWSEWIKAWCGALQREANAAEDAVRRALARNVADHDRVGEIERVGATLQRVLGYVHEHAFIGIPATSRALGLTFPTVGASLARLERLGIVEEVTGRGRDRAWGSTVYLEVFGKE